MRQGGYSHIGKTKQGGWVQFAALAISAASAASQWYQGQKGKKSATSVASRNAELIERETEQTLRRLDRTSDLRMAEARATYHAGNIRTNYMVGGFNRHGGSIPKALSSLAREMHRQRSEYVTSQQIRADIARRGGDSVAQGTGTQAALTLGRGIVDYFATK